MFSEYYVLSIAGSTLHGFFNVILYNEVYVAIVLIITSLLHKEKWGFREVKICKSYILINKELQFGPGHSDNKICSQSLHYTQCETPWHEIYAHYNFDSKSA